MSETEDMLAPIGTDREHSAPETDPRKYNMAFVDENVLMPSECVALAGLLARHFDAGRGRMGHLSFKVDGVWLGGDPAPKSDELRAIVPDDLDTDIANRLDSAIRFNNAIGWGFDLLPKPQLCVPSTVMFDLERAGGHMVGWHTDYPCDPKDRAVGIEPKIIGLTMLSDPSEYEGGELEIYTGRRVLEAKMGQGDMVMFPNFLLHRRHPVTKGARITMLTLGWGPCWK